jgi:polyhydroxybutyrate depolymerase
MRAYLGLTGGWVLALGLFVVALAPLRLAAENTTLAKAGNSTAATAPVAGQAGVFPDETITVWDQKREYRLVVPATVDLGKPAPLVFAFHGMGEDSKDNMPVATGLNELASAHKFIVVYPGAELWQLPQGWVKAWAMTPGQAAADLAFFDALLARLEGQYKIDRNQVYVTGMSNGAYFANLVGRERPAVVAAVAAHSSELGVIDVEALYTGRKFPVMLIHGVDDPIFPVASARQERDIYAAAGHEVTYVEVPGLGHAWATQVKINDQIWDFFASHPLNAPAKAAGK